MELVLPARRSGRRGAGTETEHDSEGDEGSVRRHAAQPDRAGDGDAFAVGEPVVERTRARSDRGACAQRAFDWGEPEERRPHGCANAGASGQDRSAVAVSGETSQCAGASGSDGDSGASRTGAGTNGAGEHSAGTGQVLRRAVARVQCAQYESRESRRAESGTATRTGTVAGGDRGAEGRDPRVQRSDRKAGTGELSASGADEASQRSGHADRAHLPTALGGSASLSQEPRRGLLSRTAAGTAQLGPERAADAHQQGRGSVS